MKDPVKATKLAYKTLLDGVITCNDSNVPVYIGESLKAGNNYYIVIGIISSENVPNKHMFQSSVTVELDIYAMLPTPSADPFSAVDSITQSILDLVLPSITETDLDYGADFQIKSVALDSSTYNPIEDLGQNRLASKKLTFTQTIIEQ